MKLFNNIFKTDDVQSVLNTLKKVEHNFNSPAFHLISNLIKDAISEFPEKIPLMVRESKSVWQTVYIMIANVTGDEVESGKHHMYRGVLNPLGYGNDLLLIFYSALDELVKLGYLSAEDANVNKLAVLENIKNVG
jgi:hypothetical protein